MCEKGKPCACKQCNCQFLFLYGSLKQGGPLNRVITSDISESFGYVKGELQTPAKMFSLGHFPCVVLDGDSKEQLSTIKGEIVKIKADALTLLDRVESDHYNRELLPVVDEIGISRDCWVYVWNDDFVPLSIILGDNPNHIKSGSWEINN